MLSHRSFHLTSIEYLWRFNVFFGSFDLYQDKRNEHEGVFENKMLRYDRFKKVVGTGF